jgi:hypothetical protein
MRMVKRHDLERALSLVSPYEQKEERRIREVRFTAPGYVDCFIM